MAKNNYGRFDVFIEVTTLPQTIQPIHSVTIGEVVAVLPESIPWPINVSYADRLARFGRTTESITFLAEMGSEPTVEQRTYFEGLVAGLGLPATLRSDWKNQEHAAVRLYNNGRLIVDKKTLCFTELPIPLFQPPVLTVEEAIKKLPDDVPWKFKIWLTGGLVRNGWTANDFDFIADCDDKIELVKMSKYFTDKLGWPTHVGNEEMVLRKPVYTWLVYEGGICRKP
jgi:hypothetical protein